MRFQVLDTAELRRNRRRREGHREIHWQVSLRTRMKFRTLLHELVDLETYPMTEETLLRMESLREEIRGLPGYPRRYDPERDTIVPVTTSAQR